MEFCTISPIAGLERYGTALSRRHLVLAHMLHNKEYYSYYEERRRAGDFLILDNGAYENTKPLDSAAYFNWILDLHPQVAVLPDILMSPWRKTTSAALRFLDEYADSPRLKDYQTQWMFVPQCQRAIDNQDGHTSRSEWIQALGTVVNDGRQGHHVTWIGLGRYLATEFINLPGKEPRRANLARELKKHPGFMHLKLHALGMAGGDLEELKALKSAGVESIDSSCAVWRGWQGYGLEDPAWRKEGTPCDFHAEQIKADSTHQLIETNLEVIRGIVG